MANDSFKLFVLIFVNFSINSLKENGENINYHSIQRRKVELYLFLSTHREWESFLALLLSAMIKVSIVVCTSQTEWPHPNMSFLKSRYTHQPSELPI